MYRNQFEIFVTTKKKGVGSYDVLTVIIEAHSYMPCIKMYVMVSHKISVRILKKGASCPSLSTSYPFQSLNKTIISCHTLTPRPWNPSLGKQTVLSTAEVFRVYSSNKNAAHAEEESKEANSENEKLLDKKEKSIMRKKAG